MAFSAVSLCKASCALLPCLTSASPISPASSVSGLAFPRKRSGGFSISAAAETADAPLTGVVFQPFVEVKKDELMVPSGAQVSLARQRYTDECEAAINEQINVEYSASYVYHSMYAYFDRDNVALKGMAKFFKESSEEEREHAEKLMKYQNTRGGRVKLHSILNPPPEFDNNEKGDALYAMELALSLEKLVNEKLLNLHAVREILCLLTALSMCHCGLVPFVQDVGFLIFMLLDESQVADKHNNVEMQDFIEREFLEEQVKQQNCFFFQVNREILSHSAPIIYS
nr:ferritin-3, chloroplastic-like [Ipomoea batatas]